MNISTNTSLETQAMESLNLLKLNTAGFVSWIVVGTFNLIFALLTLIILHVWKPLHSDTHVFVRNLMAAEIGNSLSFVSPAVYHLNNINYDIPEIVIQWKCFLICVIGVISTIASGTFYVVISVDRFFGAVFPILFKTRHHLYTRIVSATVWVIIISFTVLGNMSVYTNSVIIPACFGRLALTDKFLYYENIYNITVSVGSVAIYFILILFLRIQLLLAQKYGGGNITNIKNAMNNRLTKCLAFVAVLHLITFFSSSIILTIFSNFYLKGSQYGLSFNFLYLFGGTIYFLVSFVFQKDFRNGCKNLKKYIIRSSQVSNVS